MPELHRILDKAAQRFNLDHVKTHPSGGFLTVELPVTRAGIFRYYDERYPGNIRKDYKSIETLSSESFVDSLLGIPVVRLHPDVGLVEAHNIEDAEVVGAVHPKVSYTARKVKEQLSSDGLVRVLFTVFDGKAIDDIRSGAIAETSLGGQCSRRYEPGQLEGGTVYDAQQLDIVNNHLALVPAARAGECTNIKKRLFDNPVYDGVDIGLAEPGSNMSPTSTSKTFVMATSSKQEPKEAAFDAAAIQSELEATKTLLADSKAEIAGLEAKVKEQGEAIEGMVTIADARDLASKAVALTVAATKLGHEGLTLDGIFEDPAKAAAEVVAKVSKGDHTFDSLEASLAYLQGKASDVKPADTKTLDDVLDGKSKPSAKPSAMASRRAAARNALFGNK